MTSAQQTDFILGTAGHIDHGKSSLIQALTGTDPDRLAEEKRRGITIELGFARLTLPDKTTMGVVDVPGHERFVRQMISGATGIDVALLCIAADDGIMAQTVEHIAVLELLKIPSLIVALTKIDLVDEEWVAFMTGEIREYLTTTAYGASPIVAVSSRTGEGLNALTDELSRVVHTARHTKKEAGARLPIDRVFSIKGAGTVITGTLWSGTVSEGDEVEILPSHLRTRVRSVQTHGVSVTEAHAGCRTALNVNALSTSQIHSGDFLITPSILDCTDRFNADLRYLGMFNSCSKPLKSNTPVRIAHGTREVLGRVLFADDTSSLSEGQHAFAQIRLDEPLPVLWQDRFIIRSYSPVHVIGGGVVLQTHPRRTTKLTKAERALLQALAEGDETAIAHAAFSLFSLPFTARDLAQASELNEKTAQRELDALVDAKDALRLSGAQTYYVSKSCLQKYRSGIENTLLKFHAENPFSTGISKEALRQRVAPDTSAACFDALLTYTVAAKAAVVSKGFVSHPKAGAGAQKQIEQTAQQLYEILHDAYKTPPSVSELLASTKFDTSLIYKALGALEQREVIRRINRDFYFDTKALDLFERLVRTRLAHSPATAAELRDAMGVTRKYAIPLLEYFDAHAVTRRENDLRMLNKPAKS